MRIFIFFLSLFLFPFSSCSTIIPIASDICDITNDICNYSQLICEEISELDQKQIEEVKQKDNLDMIRTSLKYVSDDLSNPDNSVYVEDRELLKIKLSSIKNDLIFIHKTIKEVKSKDK